MFARRSCAQGLPELQADCSGSSMSQSYSHTSDGILNCNSSTSGIEGVSETLDLLHLEIPEYVRLYLCTGDEGSRRRQYRALWTVYNLQATAW